MTRKKKSSALASGAETSIQSLPLVRVFKAPKFAQEAQKRGISDAELCQAIKQVLASPRTYSIGGGVYKKRLNDNMDRAILVAKGGKNWFYVHIFKKSTQANITHQELGQFRAAAKVLESLKDSELDFAVNAGKLQEICHAHTDQTGK